MPIISKQFKTVLGCFATGVAIVTTAVNGKIHGLTVNAFTSVSLKPPLVLICIDTDAESCKLIKKSKMPDYKVGYEIYRHGSIFM